MLSLATTSQKIVFSGEQGGRSGGGQRRDRRGRGRDRGGRGRGAAAADTPADAQPQGRLCTESPAFATAILFRQNFMLFNA